MRSIILYSTLILLIFSCRNSQEAGRQESRLRVVNGQLVGSDDPTIKSTVAIFKSKFDREPHCTGTLIGRNHVVTAAHCLTKMPAKVGFGSKGNDSSFNVVAYKLHPSYISFRQTFDLGVIVFEGKLDPKKHQPVAIGEPKIGVPIKISGYGDIGDSRLGGGTLRIVDTSIARFRDSGREFVSVADGKGSCYGDSGGPIYIKKDDKYEVVGATSRGRSCNVGDSIDTNLWAFQDWINEAFEGLGYPLSSQEETTDQEEASAGELRVAFEDASKGSFIWVSTNLTAKSVLVCANSANCEDSSEAIELEKIERESTEKQFFRTKQSVVLKQRVKLNILSLDAEGSLINQRDVTVSVK